MPLYHVMGVRLLLTSHGGGQWVLDMCLPRLAEAARALGLLENPDITNLFLPDSTTFSPTARFADRRDVSSVRETRVAFAGASMTDGLP